MLFEQISDIVECSVEMPTVVEKDLDHKSIFERFAIERKARGISASVLLGLHQLDQVGTDVTKMIEHTARYATHESYISLLAKLLDTVLGIRVRYSNAKRCATMPAS